MIKSVIKGLWHQLKDFFACRQHPVRIFKYIAKYIWLLIIPIAKYLIATHFDLKSMIEANWVDLLVVLFILGFAVFRWTFVYYKIEDDRIIAHTGFLGMAETTVYFEDISTLSLCQGPIYRFIHACTIYIDTDAKSVQSVDIRLDLTKKKAMEIYHLVTAKTRNHPQFSFKSDKKNLVIFSLLFSSALSGAVILVSVIYELYQIVGRQFNKTIMDRVNTQLDEIEKMPSQITKYFFLAGTLIVGIWLLSFCANLMRHWNFTCKRCHNCLIVHSGRGSRRHHVINKRFINYVDYQQSFLMKLFKICSVSVQCTGYGKRRLEISALIPITTNDQADSSAQLLLPKITPVKKQIYTGKKDVRRFVTLPAVCCAIPFVAIAVLCHYFPSWVSGIRTIGLLSALPLIWLTIVKAAAAMSNSVGFDDETCTISYCRWYRFHKVVCSRSKITEVQIKQNLFSCISKTCAIVIYTRGEKTQKHSVKGLRLDEARKLLVDNGYRFITGGKQNA